jgi:hypothetical protein
MTVLVGSQVVLGSGVGVGMLQTMSIGYFNSLLSNASTDPSYVLNSNLAAAGLQGVNVFSLPRSLQSTSLSPAHNLLLTASLPLLLLIPNLLVIALVFLLSSQCLHEHYEPPYLLFE